MSKIGGRMFVQHIPGCVEADPYVVRYSTWNDLERMIRGRGHTGRLGCDFQGKDRVMILDIFESDGKVQWWVIGTAWNPPDGIPPWPYWKDVVREIGGRV